MKLIFLAFLTILIAGCAASTTNTKLGHTSERERQDILDCELEALKATGGASGVVVTNYNTSNTIANDVETGKRRGEIINACLAARGYSPKTQ